ncbi:MAG TPA: hypothetical protein VFG42_16900 [Baekduia sp.]|uniref:hypothetical protein n=1 Tax=Baekduia sp. TaxID=2600305 RepID=UPI002D792D37|nr:hypothetical protein [Baekduia sp.]HET6508476.1 hypothetical protein [Baekduia sp.]
MSLPEPLRDYGAELERAARQRHDRAPAARARRLRAGVAALAAALLAGGGLATAGGVLDSPFDHAPSAITYNLATTAPDGTLERATCRATGAGARCASEGRELPLHRIAVELQRRGTERATVSLTRLCRRPVRCRTVAGPVTTPEPGELSWETLAGLRPPRAGTPITAFASAGAAPVRGGVRYGVVGGTYAGRSYACDGADAEQPLCRLRRAATSANGILDVDRLLESAGARALVTETGRRCPLTGRRPCRGLDPATARRLASDPSALARDELVTYERQVRARGF